MRRFVAGRALPWTLFGLSAFVGLILLVSVVAVAGVKSIPVAGPRVTVSASPLPAETVTVTDTASADRVDELETQLTACNTAWRTLASRETDAVGMYNDALQSIVAGIQNGDTSALNDAASQVSEAGEIIKEITPDVGKADATCTP